jgi:hypothetical protein
MTIIRKYLYESPQNVVHVHKHKDLENELAVSDFMPTILAIQESEIRRMVILGQPEQKVHKTFLSQQKKLAMWWSCHPSYGRKHN